jgi:hypothetical protein
MILCIGLKIMSFPLTSTSGEWLWLINQGEQGATRGQL